MKKVKKTAKGGGNVGKWVAISLAIVVGIPALAGVVASLAGLNSWKDAISDVFHNSDSSSSEITTSDTSEEPSSEVTSFNAPHVLRQVGATYGQTINVAIEPANATDQTVTWTRAWDGAQSGVVSDYLSMEVEADTHSAFIYAVQPWNGNIVITVSLDGFTDSCSVNWNELASSVSMTQYTVNTGQGAPTVVNGSHTSMTIQPDNIITFYATSVAEHAGIVVDHPALTSEIVSGTSLSSTGDLQFTAVSSGDTVIKIYNVANPDAYMTITVTVYQAVTGLSLDNNNLTF